MYFAAIKRRSPAVIRGITAVRSLVADAKLGIQFGAALRDLRLPRPLLIRPPETHVGDELVDLLIGDGSLERAHLKMVQWVLNAIQDDLPNELAGMLPRMPGRVMRRDGVQPKLLRVWHRRGKLPLARIAVTVRAVHIVGSLTRH